MIHAKCSAWSRVTCGALENCRRYFCAAFALLYLRISAHGRINVLCKATGKQRQYHTLSNTKVVIVYSVDGFVFYEHYSGIDARSSVSFATDPWKYYPDVQTDGQKMQAFPGFELFPC
jgi:hypothetical protein